MSQFVFILYLWYYQYALVLEFLIFPGKGGSVVSRKSTIVVNGQDTILEAAIKVLKTNGNHPMTPQQIAEEGISLHGLRAGAREGALKVEK